MNHNENKGSSRLKPTSTFSSIQRPKHKQNVGQYRSRNSLSSNHNQLDRTLKIEKSMFVPQRPIIEKSFLRSFHSDVLKAVKSNDQTLERPVKRYKPQPLISNNLSLLNSSRKHDSAVAYEAYVEKVTISRLGEIAGAKLVLSSEWDTATNSYKRDALVWSLFYNNSRLCFINDHVIKEISFSSEIPLTLILGLKYDVAVQLPGKGAYSTREIAFTLSDNNFNHLKRFVISYYHTNQTVLDDFPESREPSGLDRFLAPSSNTNQKSLQSQKLTTRPDPSLIQTIPFSQRLSIPNAQHSKKLKNDSNMNNPRNIFSRGSNSTDLKTKPQQKPQKRATRVNPTRVNQVFESAIKSQASDVNITSLDKAPLSAKPVSWMFNSPFNFVFKDLKTLDITPEDFRKLDSGNFLNDTLINFFLKYFHQVTANPNQKLADSIYLFNSFFYTKHLGGYNQVKKWTSKVDLFKYPFVFVPINLKMHWHLVIVYNLPVLLLDPVHKLSSDEALSDKLRATSKVDDCVLFLLNSTGGSTDDNQAVVKNLKDYIVDEGKDKLNVKIDRKRIVMKDVHVPQQNNYCDCGVFLIHYVHMFMSNHEKALNLMFSPLNIEGHLYNTVWKPHAMAAKRENLKRRLVNFRIENETYQAGLPAATLYDEGDVEAHEVKVLGPTARKLSVTEIAHISTEDTKEIDLSGAIKKLDETIEESDDDLVDSGESAASMLSSATSINSKKRKALDETEDMEDKEMSSGNQSRAASVESVESMINDGNADGKIRTPSKRSARSAADTEIREVVMVDDSLDEP